MQGDDPWQSNLGIVGRAWSFVCIPTQPLSTSGVLFEELDSITVVFKCGLINLLSNWMLSTSPIFACHRTICQKQDKGKLE